MQKYIEIFQVLQLQIQQGEFPKHTLLPSEHDLMKKYHASRETIRKALKELEIEGFIQKKQGKGSIVLDRTRHSFPMSQVTSFYELQEERHLNAKTVLIENRIIPAPEFLVALGLVSPEEKMIELVRQRWLDGKPEILDYDYIRTTLVPAVTNGVAEQSLYQYLEEELGIKISYAQKEFITEHVTEEDKKYLSVGNDSHVMVVRSEVHLEDTTFLQYTESRHCLDKFRFVEFARRAH